MKPRHLHTVHTEGLNQLNHDQLFYTSFLKYSFSLPGQTFRKKLSLLLQKYPWRSESRNIGFVVLDKLLFGFPLL